MLKKGCAGGGGGRSSPLKEEVGGFGKAQVTGLLFCCLQVAIFFTGTP